MHMQFPGLDPIPILFEDRSVLAIDKPTGWMLIPYTWQRTNRNLQAAIDSSIATNHFWAKSRNLKFLQHGHRLDAETTGILLFVKNRGAVNGISDLFGQRKMEKVYLAVVNGEPKQAQWTCDKAIGPVPKQYGRMMVDPKNGKDAETSFKLLESRDGRSLIECRPVTGRTHQIRIHLLDAKLRIVGDPLYGDPKLTSGSREFPMALRAVKLAFKNPFSKKDAFVRAPREAFLNAFGFGKPENGGLTTDGHG
jgi:RluA family pseudouridine synthase